MENKSKLKITARDTLLIFAFILILSPFPIQAQYMPEVASVEKSIFGIQFSSIGFWLHLLG